MNDAITADQCIALLSKTTLSDRRPIRDIDTINGVFGHADPLITAWQDNRLVGVAHAMIWQWTSPFKHRALAKP